MWYSIMGINIRYERYAMKEEEYMLNGRRVLSLVGETYIVSYTKEGTFIVLAKNDFSNESSCKRFKNNLATADKINSYLQIMKFESTNNTELISAYIKKANDIMMGIAPINSLTVGKVLSLNKNEIGFLDLGNDCIVLYSDGLVELQGNKQIVLGSIAELLNNVNETCKSVFSILADRMVISMSALEKGFNGLGELYRNYLSNVEKEKEKEAEYVRAKSIIEDTNAINKPRELALCIIAVRATQHLCNGRTWIKKYLVAKDLYLGVYERIYNEWIQSKKPFSFQFIDNELNEKYLKPIADNNLTGVV